MPLLGVHDEPADDDDALAQELPWDQCICGVGRRIKPRPDCWATVHDFEDRGA